MNNLTTADLSRIFGERIGQEYLVCYNIEGNPVIEPITPKVIEDIEPDSHNKRDLLLLTPLEKISDEDAIKFVLADGITGFSKFDILREDHVIIIKWGTSTFAERSIKFFNKSWLAESLKQPQLVTLKNLGYDIPLFFGLNHPDNGKTLIELGVAIDKETLK